MLKLKLLCACITAALHHDDQPVHSVVTVTSAGRNTIRGFFDILEILYVLYA